MTRNRQSAKAAGARFERLIADKAADALAEDFCQWANTHSKDEAKEGIA